MRTLFIILFIPFVMQSNLLMSQEKEIEGNINVVKKDEFITLKAQVQNDGLLIKPDLNYLFVALKKNQQGGYSNNKQSGEFSLQPHQQKEVSTIRLNLSDQDELKVYLFIRQKTTLISKDSVIIGKVNYKKKIAAKPESSYYLKGIVVNEAITKIGKDFHDFFYQKYLLSGKKYPFILKISEKPNFGRTSIITIYADDHKIYEFYSRPDEAYLNANVQAALQRIHIYANKKANLLNNNKM